MFWKLDKIWYGTKNAIERNEVTDFDDWTDILPRKSIKVKNIKWMQDVMRMEAYFTGTETFLLKKGFLNGMILGNIKCLFFPEKLKC